MEDEVESTKAHVKAVIKSLKIIRKEYAEDFSIVVEMNDIFDKGLADNWKDLLSCYETRKFRKEVIHELQNINIKLDTLIQYADRATKYLKNISMKLDTAISYLGKIDGKLANISYLVDSLGSKLVNQVTMIRLKVDGLRFSSFSNCAEITSRTSDYASSLKNREGTVACLLCKNRFFCRQKFCTGFVPGR